MFKIRRYYELIAGTLNIEFKFNWRRYSVKVTFGKPYDYVR